MSEQKGIPVAVEISCCPVARGMTPDEIAAFLKDGFVYLDIMPIRREITAQEKLTNPNIPPAATHTSEPMMVFFRIGTVMPPLPSKAIEPGVN